VEEFINIFLKSVLWIFLIPVLLIAVATAILWGVNLLLGSSLHYTFTDVLLVAILVGIVWIANGLRLWLPDLAKGKQF
jgi:hypothetical protein